MQFLEAVQQELALLSLPRGSLRCLAVIPTGVDPYLTIPAHCPLQLVGAGLADPACATVHAPVALLPVPYPRETFLRAKAAALAFNAMVDAVARDEEYLSTVLAAAAQEDPFTVGSEHLGGRHCGMRAGCEDRAGLPESSGWAGSLAACTRGALGAFKAAPWIAARVATPAGGESGQRAPTLPVTVVLGSLPCRLACFRYFTTPRRSATHGGTARACWRCCDQTTCCTRPPTACCRRGRRRRMSAAATWVGALCSASGSSLCLQSRCCIIVGRRLLFVG